MKLALIPLNFRDDFLAELKDTVNRADGKIGTANITLAREAKSQPPLVKNWLADYDDIMGVEYHEDIERSNYFVRSRNVRELTDQDKEVLRRLFYFYDLLKLKITDLGGLGSLSAVTLDIEVTEAEEKPLKRFEPLFDPLELLEEKIPSVPLKPAVAPSVPAKPPAELEKEIEAKRKAEEERIARLEREMKPKVAPPPKVEIPKPLEVPKAPPRPEVAPPKIKPAPEFKPTKPPRIEAALPSPIPSSKPRAPVKITSIDDIKKLNLDDFRSYREVPCDSAQVITEKINSILAEASPLDKIKALSFWKESELYKLYIEMGRESMAQGISVKELAEKRRAEEKPFLSHEEFEAIVEISGSIG